MAKAKWQQASTHHWIVAGLMMATVYRNFAGRWTVGVNGYDKSGMYESLEEAKKEAERRLLEDIIAAADAMGFSVVERPTAPARVG